MSHADYAVFEILREVLELYKSKNVPLPILKTLYRHYFIMSFAVLYRYFRKRQVNSNANKLQFSGYFKLMVAIPDCFIGSVLHVLRRRCVRAVLFLQRYLIACS